MIHLKYKYEVNFMKLTWFSKMPPPAATQATARL